MIPRQRASACSVIKCFRSGRSHYSNPPWARGGHGEGIVHRDVKPANPFLTTNHSDEPLLEVLDFGVAKVMNNLPTSQLTVGAHAIFSLVPNVQTTWCASEIRDCDYLRPQLDIDGKRSVPSLSGDADLEYYEFEVGEARSPSDATRKPPRPISKKETRQGAAQLQTLTQESVLEEFKTI